MTLNEELYFEIELTGSKSELKQFAKFLKSGELDEFFEITPDYICYDDSFADADEDGETSFVFSNDDLGIEIDEFNPEDFLDVFCKAAKSLFVSGHLYDIEDEEYSFTSEAGESGYHNAKKPGRFNDELDDEAYREDREEDD